MTRTLRILFPAVCVLAFVAGRICAVPYQAADLGLLSDGWVSDINNHGVIVGTVGGSTTSSRGFAWSASSGFTYLDPQPGYSQSVAWGLNDAGQVVGYSSYPGLQRATSWAGGTTATDVGVFPSGDYPGYSVATAVNGDGSVIGYSVSTRGYTHAFLWTAKGGLEDLNSCDDASETIACAVSDSGAVVGRHGAHSFIWTSATGIRDLEEPDLLYTCAVGVNGSGHVLCQQISGTVGGLAYLWQGGHDLICLGSLYDGGPEYTSASDLNSRSQVVGDSCYQPFVWDIANGMQALPVSDGLRNVRASAINDNGTIAGYAYDDRGQEHLILWTPVPEPSSLVALLMGMGTASGWALRRRRC